ncbi:hypothetical protein AB4562_10300 [Vibrio sp. 10N.222.54.A1]|uniref:hypothetical protein n=1 Tax=unclassified Vibrio TaxID=2614977 RepID=UPI000C83A02F|nr:MULTISPECIES: hypothetical protein [unclassified Vibrio]PMK76099.1 hypothetical protein BCT92_22080 [Vibrio sp. 10N.261.52.E5]TKF79783.1 hypothetical protein FCV65_21565 [Vibrio sp. F13]
MHLVCKFISSSSLSTNDLQYVLTPDECVGLFSRVRTPKDILAQLPSTLLQQITASAKKNVHSLLNAIRVELVKANWVCLSSNVRRRPLTSKQLANFPRLKLHVDRVSNSTAERVHKANYQQVVDDVPLARHYNFSPVEPSPEHKIVVEFAGQWSSNAGCLMLGTTDTQKEKVTVGKSDRENKHRSLATFKDLELERKTLYIKIPCSDQPQPILLKLAEDLQPVDKETQMEEWDNVLVPVVPLYKSGSSWDGYTSGRVYIIWNGEVWRELQVTNDGYFADVDMSNSRKKTTETRHVNIDGSSLFPGENVAFERFTILQDGVEVFSGELDINEQARVFSLVAEEVEIKFVGFEHEQLMVPTHPSPMKASSTLSDEVLGYPLPHIWIPYKIKGECQGVYLYYASQALSDAAISELESNYESMAVSLAETSDYSSNQEFTQQTVFALPELSESQKVKAVVNVQNDCNVAAVNIPPPGSEIILRYRVLSSTDQPDDYFMLQNDEHSWSQKAYFRCAKVDEDGYLNLRFSGWPEKVKEVDILRGAHASRGIETPETFKLREKVKVTDLLG